jgi:FkbM family methyltransferase
MSSFRLDSSQTIKKINNIDLMKFVSEMLQSVSIKFNVLEIGARPIGGVEKFHSLVDYFPGSNIYSLEPDKKLCEELNKKAPNEGIKYFPIALGKTEEKRDFYETILPMCNSLYEPNVDEITNYNGMDVARIKNKKILNTVSIDKFVKDNKIKSIDFIKIDTQGAELEIFQGGLSILDNVLVIISEVSFMYHYKKQPLFGDIQSFLLKKGFMFQQFIDLGGSCFKPFIINNNPYFVSRQMWGDALFIKEIINTQNLTSIQFLKIGISSLLYNNLDVMFFCFSKFDETEKTTFCNIILSYLVEKGEAMIKEKKIYLKTETTGTGQFNRRLKSGRGQVFP